MEPEAGFRVEFCEPGRREFFHQLIQTDSPVFGQSQQPSRRVIANSDGQRCHDDLSRGWFRTPLPLCQPNSIDPEKLGLRALQNPSNSRPKACLLTGWEQNPSR